LDESEASAALRGDGFDEAIAHRHFNFAVLLYAMRGRQDEASGHEHALTAQIVKTYRGVDDVRGLSLRHSASLLSRPPGQRTASY
jgi:hypothetical protein